MSDCNRSTISDFKWGAILGLIVGVVAGLMYAPDKGEKTRAKVRSKWQEIQEESQGYLDDLRHLAEDNAPYLKEQAKIVKHRVKGKSASIKKEAGQKIAKARQVVEERLVEKNLVS